MLFTSLKNKFIVAIDQGTTSCRAILFNIKGKSLFKSQIEFKGGILNIEKDQNIFILKFLYLLKNF